MAYWRKKHISEVPISISQDEEKRLEYEAMEKAIRDYNQIILEAEQRGEVKGREEGIERVDKLNILLINDKCYQGLCENIR